MKIVFIGCVEFSRTALEQVLLCEEAQVVGVITKDSSAFNSDFCSLEEIAKKNDIPCLIVDKNSTELMVDWIEKKAPDVIYCFGWSHLLPSEVLALPRLGAIGYHPAPLPRNRGRHPIIWTLVLGLSSTASTFFFMDQGADSGDILSQEFIPVEHQDDARSLYQKLSKAAMVQIALFTKQLSQGNYVRVPQDSSKANYWRKRTKKDGEIDWRMSAQSIYNVVRALTKPYVGAHCLYLDQEVKIWKAEIANDEGDTSNLEPGKVCKVEKGIITVKCGEGLLRILDHEFTILPEEGCYI